MVIKRPRSQASDATIAFLNESGFRPFPEAGLEACQITLTPDYSPSQQRIPDLWGLLAAPAVPLN